jgi:hypothetical protein
MPSRKTLLTPEEQWNRTVQYMDSLYNGFAKSSTWMPGLWVVRYPHRLLCLGDVLLVTQSNGMIERYGMTGVSSKGARLNNYYIPLRPDSETVHLPGDLIDTRWDDPAIGRFVADLRASSRRRVGASIPAPNPMPFPDRDVQGLRFDGCYRSRREPKHKRVSFFNRDYLRFFPDGTVISGTHYDVIYVSGGLISSVSRERFMSGPWGTSGKFTLEGESISFSILLDGEVVEQYEGKIDGVYLHLSKHCRQGWSRPRDNSVYKFCPWGE